MQLRFVPDLYVSRKPSPSLLFMFCEETEGWEDVTQWSVSSVRENGVSDGSIKGVTHQGVRGIVLGSPQEN